MRLFIPLSRSHMQRMENIERKDGSKGKVECVGKLEIFKFNFVFLSEMHHLSPIG